MIKWFDSRPHTSLTKYIPDHQEHKYNDTRKKKYQLIDEGVKTTDNQYYITHKKSILSNTVTGNNIYNNYSYTSSVNWEIEKTPENPSKKSEFNNNKLETGLKQ